MSIMDFRRKKKPKPQPPAPAPPPVSPPPPAVPSQPIRVTDDSDGTVINRGYAYYSQAFINGRGVFVFVGHEDGRPRFFHLDNAGELRRLGPLLDYTGTGEGWGWTPTGEIVLTDGPRLRRVNPFTRTDDILLDISATHPGHDLWQAHSSDDGLTHSATVRQITQSGSYPKIGTVVQRPTGQRFIGADGELDESHIDASGRWLIIEQSNDNLIIDLHTGAEHWIANSDGALAHIDCGDGVMVGEDDQRGACTSIDLRTMERRVLFQTWGMGHVSVRAGRCLLSGKEQLALVALDGSGVTPLLAHGMTGDGYDFQVHANLDHAGRVAVWVSNAAGRFDLYVCRIAHD